MAAGKRPEIELEVSCGGTFRVATEEMACRITVLDPGSHAPVVASAPSAAVPAAVPAASQEADPFYEKVVSVFEKEMGQGVENFASTVGSAVDGATCAAKIGNCSSLLNSMVEKSEKSSDTMVAGVSKAQARIVDLRFALTFLKNHALFGRLAKEGEDTVTIAKDELEKLATKIENAFSTAQDINSKLAAIKTTLTSQDTLTEGELLPTIRTLGNFCRDLLGTSYILTDETEQKRIDSSITAEDAGEKAAAAFEAVKAGNTDKEASLSEDDSREQSMPNDDNRNADDEDEMSDEDALKKLAEFGLT